MKLALVVLLLTAGLAHAQAPHPCATDAIARAKPLLTLHFGEGKPVENLSVEDTAKPMPPLKSPGGKTMLDVLEVWGHVYKGSYRMRFLYLRVKETCALIGQEVIEAPLTGRKR